MSYSVEPKVRLAAVTDFTLVFAASKTKVFARTSVLSVKVILASSPVVKVLTLTESRSSRPRVPLTLTEPLSPTVSCLELKKIVPSEVKVPLTSISVPNEPGVSLSLPAHI